MKTILSFLLSVCFFTTHAQNAFREHNSGELNFRKKEKVRDTILPAGRNEIYLNIAPVFTTLLGAPPQNEAYFSLFYKRTLKNPRTALRLGFVFRPETESFLNLSYPDLYLDETDSTRTLNQFYDNKENKFQMNAGMEYRFKGNKRWTTFLAMDVLAGHFHKDYSLRNIPQTLDSSGNWQSNMSNTEWIDHRSTGNFYFGLTPKFGIRYAFNPHWMMSVQTGGEFTYLISDHYHRNSAGTAIVVTPASSLEYNMNGLLEEFCIVYRF
ncbi:hypothetical protein BH11BAC7_BH11BAC7_29330 [soil metagenome]